MKLARWLMALALLVMPVAFAWQATDPPDDPNPEWPGQKAWCSNVRTIPHPCHCSRATSCDAQHQENPDLLGDGMGTKCQTYCRKEKCGCLHPCT